MPYGPPAKGQPETAEFDRFMERCVPKVKRGSPDVNAYAVCKAQWRKRHAGARALAGRLRG